MLRGYTPVAGKELIAGGRYAWMCVSKNGIMFVHDIVIISDANGLGKCTFYPVEDGEDCEITVTYESFGVSYDDTQPSRTYNRLFLFSLELYQKLSDVVRRKDLIAWLRYLQVTDVEDTAARLLGTEREPPAVHTGQRPALRLMSSR